MADGDATESRDRVVRIAGQEIALGAFSLLLMLIAILVPTVMYSLNLRQPTPAQLLVAISIGMFASVLYLWVLDATSTIHFRSVWISRSIYGAAIVSILGTSVGVYKDAFALEQYPFAGEWLITVQHPSAKTIVARRPVALTYSRNTDVYWGYGAGPDAEAESSMSVEIIAFDPKERQLEIRLRDLQGLDEVIAASLSELKPRTSFSSTTKADAQYVVRLARRN